MTTLREVVALMDRWYPPALAEDWDAPGLVCGDPDADVRRILLAVDPVLAVAEEAIEIGADLVITHHPLFLKGVHGVAATTPKGRVVHRLIAGNCGLLAAHTNADSPAQGVSEAMAQALGLSEIEPLVADPADPLDKFVVYVPLEAAESVREALTGAGAGAIGDYDSCTFSTQGQGRFRPLEGADPAIGRVGDLEIVDEARVEAVAERRLRDAVLRALRAAHPYEEPAYEILELASTEHPSRGSGRWGRIDPCSLHAFADLVGQSLPETAHGVRVSGDPERRVETVALCGGAGDFLLETARRRGADVYVTSDLRHHPASELREHGEEAPALVDVAHWAAEWTWLPVLRARLESELRRRGDTVEVLVSTTDTDPWTFRV